MTRIFSISDLHVDYKENLHWVKNLSNQEFKDDYLLIAGDISDNPVRFAKTLSLLTEKFFKLFFIPGNHDLWIRKDSLKDSHEKFKLLLEICDEFGVLTKPYMIDPDSNNPILIQPLFGWYTKPEDGDDSLYLPKTGDDPKLRMWADNKVIKWPELNGYRNIAEFYTKMNDLKIAKSKEYNIISLSHFLPRQDLIFGVNGPPLKNSTYFDPYPKFNFSRVAGTSILEEQIREIGSSVHIYGHQHRNRYRFIDDITYIAHCLGYPRERMWGNIRDDEYLPKLIWSSDDGFVLEKSN